MSRPACKKNRFTWKKIILILLVPLIWFGWNYYRMDYGGPYGIYGSTYSERQRKHYNILINDILENGFSQTCYPPQFSDETAPIQDNARKLTECDDAPLFHVEASDSSELPQLSLGAWGEADLIREADGGNTDACMELAIRFLSSHDSMTKRLYGRYWLERAQTLGRPGIDYVIALCNRWMGMKKSDRSNFTDYDFDKKRFWYGKPELASLVPGYGEYKNALSSGDDYLFIAAVLIEPSLYDDESGWELFHHLGSLSPRPLAQLVKLKFFEFFYYSKSGFCFFNYYRETIEESEPLFSTKSWKWLPESLQMDLMKTHPMQQKFDRALEESLAGSQGGDPECAYVWLMLRINEIKPLSRREWERVITSFETLYRAGDVRVMEQAFEGLREHGRRDFAMIEGNKLEEWIRFYYHAQSRLEGYDQFCEALKQMDHTSYGLSKFMDELYYVEIWLPELARQAVDNMQKIRDIDLCLLPNGYTLLKFFRTAPEEVRQQAFAAMEAGHKNKLPLVMYNLACCYLEAGDDGKAIALFNELLDLPCDDSADFVQDKEWSGGFNDTISASLSHLINLYVEGKTNDLSWLKFYDKGTPLTRDYCSLAPCAHCNMGIIFERGLGVSVDMPKAINCYRCADDRSARANLHLGLIYEEGRPGIPADPRQAAQYYEAGLKLIPKLWIPKSERACKEELKEGLQRVSRK